MIINDPIVSLFHHTFKELQSGDVFRNQSGFVWMKVTHPDSNKHFGVRLMDGLVAYYLDDAAVTKLEVRLVVEGPLRHE